MDKAKIIGESIRYLRKQAKITQSELANHIGTQAQISRIEKGEVIPLCTTLYEISSKLGVDINYFYHQAYIPRVDYVKEVKYQIRKAIRERNYHEVDQLIKVEEDNVAFKIQKNLQFIIWHKGITEYYVRNNIEKSLMFFNTAFNIGKENKEKLITLQDIEILNSEAIIYNEIQDYDQSVQVYNKALTHLKYLTEVSEIKVEIRLCYGIAKSLLKLKKYDESIKYCKRGINLCIREEFLYLLGELHYEIAQNYQFLNNRNSALKHYLNAKNLFDISNKLSFINAVNEKIEKLQPVTDTL